MKKWMMYILLTFLVNTLNGQDNFFVTNNWGNFSQYMKETICKDVYCYNISSTVCTSGECVLFSKMDKSGNFIFMKEISTMDINSYRAMSFHNDTIVLTGKSTTEKGIRTHYYNLEGELLKDMIVIREETADKLDFSWPVDVLYLDDYYYVVLNENLLPGEGARHFFIYKVDYEGNVVDHTQLPFILNGSVYTLSQLPNGNLFVTRLQRDSEPCNNPNQQDNLLNADIFIEIERGSMTIVRQLKDVCHQSTTRIGFDATVLPNGHIVRGVLYPTWDEWGNYTRQMALIMYDTTWQEIGLKLYEPLDLISYYPLVLGSLGQKVFVSNDGECFYVLGANRHMKGDDKDEFWAFNDRFIQKWTLDMDLVWTHVIRDTMVHKRIYMFGLEETDIELILSGGVFPDSQDPRTFDLAVMSLDLDGCYNGDCSDTIYFNEPPVSVIDIDLILDNNEVAIYPNPTTNEVQVESQKKINKIELFSAKRGKIKEITDIENTTITLNLEHQHNGIYYIIVHTDSSTIAKKVIKI